MNTAYLERTIEPVIRKAANEFPAVILTGPRQSGKTTLLLHLFGNDFNYVSLDEPDVRVSAVEDPRSFLALHSPPAIIDEVQHATDLLSYIKRRIDSDRSRPGQYLLAGSQNLPLSERVTESLAGRAAVLRLLPLSRRELEGQPQAPLACESSRLQVSQPQHACRQLWEDLVRGSYPKLAVNPEQDAHRWHSSYIQTYLEREVRTIRLVGDLTQFHRFHKMLAARSAQLLNLAGIARDLGVALNTIKAWLSVLEATYQVVVLRPYFASAGKRLVKTPKVYFTDTGTLCHLAGLRDPSLAASGPLGGAILETAVLSEILKTLTHRGLDPRIWFWRTIAGSEVDFVVESDGRLIPLEVKLSATPRPAMAASIRRFRSDMKGATMPGFLVHPGDTRLPLGNGVTALPFCEL